MPTARTSKRIHNHPHTQRAHAQHRPKQPRISRTKLQTLRENLDNTQVALNETLDRFWIVPESDVRGTLVHARKQISKAVTLLSKAA
jgi:hypothetical protein